MNLVIYIGSSVFLLIGFTMACLPFLRQLYSQMNIYNRYRVIQASENKTIISKYYDKILLILDTSFGVNKKRYLLLLLVVSFLIGISISLLLYQTGSSLFIILLVSILSIAMPFIIILFRLQSIRSAGSHEMEHLLVELISQYRINYCNMYEAIDQTIPRLANSPHSQKSLIKLSLTIKQADSDVAIIKAVNNFNYALKTNWSTILCENLKYSLIYGENISQALDDILEEAKTMNSIYEKDRQQNNEALFMIKYVTPLVYLLSVYAMIAIIGFDFSKYIDYQFFNKIGLKFFLLILIFMIINSGIYVLLKKRKRDF